MARGPLQGPTLERPNYNLAPRQAPPSTTRRKKDLKYTPTNCPPVAPQRRTSYFADRLRPPWYIITSTKKTATTRRNLRRPPASANQPPTIHPPWPIRGTAPSAKETPRVVVAENDPKGQKARPPARLQTSICEAINSNPPHAKWRLPAPFRPPTKTLVRNPQTSTAGSVTLNR